MKAGNYARRHVGTLPDAILDTLMRYHGCSQHNGPDSKACLADFLRTDLVMDVLGGTPENEAVAKDFSTCGDAPSPCNHDYLHVEDEVEAALRSLVLPEIREDDLNIVAGVVVERLYNKGWLREAPDRKEAR